MIPVSNIEKGMIINYNGKPNLVIEKTFYKPGKGSAIYRTKLKDIQNGKIVPVTYRSGDKVEELQVETKTMQFVYIDGNNAYFMDPETYEQEPISLDLIPDRADFLHTEGHYVFVFFEGRVMTVNMPPKLTIAVSDTVDAVKGNTANNATKEAVLETGAKIQVPLFINTGDKIVVNTENRSYYSKANE